MLAALASGCTWGPNVVMGERIEWSPDGSHMLFAYDDGFAVADRQGNAATLFTWKQMRDPKQSMNSVPYSVRLKWIDAASIAVRHYVSAKEGVVETPFPIPETLATTDARSVTAAPGAIPPERCEVDPSEVEAWWYAINPSDSRAVVFRDMGELIFHDRKHNTAYAVRFENAARQHRGMYDVPLDGRSFKPVWIDNEHVMTLWPHTTSREKLEVVIWRFADDGTITSTCISANWPKQLRPKWMRIRLGLWTNL